MFSLIVAHDNNYGIGKNNLMPWPFNKEDMRQFKNKTIGRNNNSIIMGLNTFKSLNNKPLKYRMNYVLTSKADTYNNSNNEVNLFFVSSYEELFSKIKNEKHETNWIIGGERVYNEFIEKYFNLLDEIHITKIFENYDCDVYFPNIFENNIIKDNIKVKEKENKIINNCNYIIYSISKT